MAGRTQARDTAHDPSRRQVTVLFADLADYTPLAESLGEEATFYLLKRVMGSLIDEIHRHEGTVQDLAGDGVMAVFGAPLALEDAPLRACRTALGLLEKIAELAEETEPQHGLRLRIGLNSGPVILGEVGGERSREFKVVGDTVNTAARIQTLAQPGQIMVSDSTYRLVAPFVDATDAGEHVLKGKSEPQRTFVLDAIKQTVTRFEAQVERGLSRFVNRSDQLAQLEKCWQAARGGVKGVVDLAGEAGMGKSRLVRHFRRQATGDGDVVLVGHCSPDGRDTPFLPFVEIFRSSIRLVDPKSASAVEGDFTRQLRALELPPDEHWPYLANLIGAETGSALESVDSETIGVRTRTSLREVLRQSSRRSPTVLYVEDLHWIDPASEQVLKGLIEARDQERLLVITTRRTDYRPPWLRAASDQSADRPIVTSIPLEPLEERHSTELANSRLGTDGLDPDLRQLLLGRTSGNPLFVEELASFLLSAGHIETEGTGDGASLKVTALGVSAAVPASLEGLILGRIDRLDDAERAVLRIASVVGRRFDVELIADVGQIEDPLPQLRTLEQRDLVFSSSQGTFTFKHALTQDVIYGSILSDDKERLHLEVARGLEQKHGDGALEVANDLAHHYSKTQETEKSVRYLFLAARKSYQLFALAEVEQRLRSALALIEANRGKVDESLVLDVLLLLARLFTDEGDAGLIAEVFEPYRDLAESADRERKGRFFVFLGFSLSVSGRLAQGKEILVRALSLAEDSDDPAAIAQASLWLAMHYAFWDDPEVNPAEALRVHAERGYENAVRAGDGWIQAYCLYTLAIDAIGTPSDCKPAIDRLYERDRDGGDPMARQLALTLSAWLDLSSNDAESAVAKAGQAEELALAGNQLSVSRTIRGFGWAMEGRTEEGLTLLEEVWQRSSDNRNVCNQLVLAGVLGLVLLLNGKLGRAVRWLDERYEQYREIGGRALHLGFLRLYLAEAYLGIVLSEERPSFAVVVENLGFLIKTVPFARRKARKALEEALELFRRDDARGAIAWTELDLGLLSKAEGKEDEARCHLEEALNLAQAAKTNDIRDRARLALEGI